MNARKNRQAAGYEVERVAGGWTDGRTVGWKGGDISQEKSK